MTSNAALWRIALVRLSTDQMTRDYLARRVSEGGTKREAIRCLKRYIAREMFNALPKPTLWVAPRLMEALKPSEDGPVPAPRKYPGRVA